MSRWQASPRLTDRVVSSFQIHEYSHIHYLDKEGAELVPPGRWEVRGHGTISLAATTLVLKDLPTPPSLHIVS